MHLCSSVVELLLPISSLVAPPREGVGDADAKRADQRCQHEAADEPVPDVFEHLRLGHLIRGEIQGVAREHPVTERQRGVEDERQDGRDGDVAREHGDGFVQA